MKQLLFVAAGGAAGALLRYAIALTVTVRPGHWPLSTLLVNIVGSLLIGVVYVLIVERATLHPDWRYVLMVGVLGALTTFSTFSLEALLLVEAGHWGAALAYTLGSVVLCLGAASMGIWLARSVAF